MLLVYTPDITNRIRYTFDHVIKDLVGLEYTLTKDIEEFKRYEKPKLNYGIDPVGDELFIYSHALLSQKGVKNQDISIMEHKGVKTLFTSNANSFLPFDPFASSFYMLSRYEEYLPYIRDQYGRYPAKESIAYKSGFLDKPVVNLWALQVREAIRDKYPSLKFRERTYAFTPTYDVDSAYAYINKGLLRTVGGYLKSLRALDVETLAARTQALFGSKPDPFDSFDWLLDIKHRYDLDPIFFFLVGDYDEYDKNISIQILKFQSLIKSVADNARVGVHPSFASNKSYAKLKKEVSRLSAVLKREIKLSRQHFLKIELPTTYQNLLELDITDDYSMGYAAQLGFRAGVTTPFYFYNLDQELATNLLIHPFSVMDVTLRHYLGLNQEEALARAKQVIQEVKNVNGHLTTVWHNNSFSEEQEWRGVESAV